MSYETDTAGNMVPTPEAARLAAQATEELMARRSAAACSPRELAEKITERLFTVGGDPPQKGTRLEIRQRKDDADFGRMNERPLGGWCMSAAVDQILRILEENAPVLARKPASSDSDS